MGTKLISKDDLIYQEVLALRYNLFFREHDLPKDILFDELEETSTHIASTEGRDLIAYARLSDLGQSRYKISQVVVQPELQSRGHGNVLLKHVVACAWSKGATVIELNARSFATGLYKALGFVEVGEEYISEFTRVAHVKMELTSGG